MKKEAPELASDAEVESFVETADLSEYDLSAMKAMRFELRRKDSSPSACVCRSNCSKRVHSRAAREGILFTSVSCDRRSSGRC